MSGRILILDSMATNRIVLKVKMAAAQYDVDTASSRVEALAAIKAHKPDLLLLNLSDPTEDRHGFCREMRANPDTKSISIVCVGIADTSQARFAALDAGADDVLPRPISDNLMLARIRSLLRRRNVGLEWELRDGTSRALGFEEEAAPRIAPATVLVLSHSPDGGPKMAANMQTALGHSVSLATPATVLLGRDPGPKPDLLVIDGSGDLSDSTALFQLISDLQSRPETNASALFVVVPTGQMTQSAMLYDLGADDVVESKVTAAELKLRCQNIIDRKFKADYLRDRVRNGLHAAVTDPLTGLYNRRYAETHLSRLAAQSRSARCEYALMVLDIDHFKAINDTYGHQAGDAVLKSLADRLKGSLRAIDLIARIGGEEFLIAMPNTSAEVAHSAAERLRSLCTKEPFALGDGLPDIDVTVSVGVAVDKTDDLFRENCSELIGRADAALYAAKSGGRNMVSVSNFAA